MICSLHELVTKAVLIKIVNCGDDDDDGSDGISIQEVPRDAFYPLCSRISYKKYWITVCSKLRWQAFPHFSVLLFLSKKNLAHNITILCVLVPHTAMLFNSCRQYLTAWLIHKLMKWEWHLCHIMKGYEGMYGNCSQRMWCSHYFLAGCKTTIWQMHRTFN